MSINQGEIYFRFQLFIFVLLFRKPKPNLEVYQIANINTAHINLTYNFIERFID